MTKATVKLIKLDNGINLEGLQLDDGSFGVAVSAITDTFSLMPYRVTKDIKALLGKDYQFIKCKTDLKPQPFNVVNLHDFEKVLRQLDRQENATARAMVDALIGLSLHQLFCESFGGCQICNKHCPKMPT